MNGFPTTEVRTGRQDEPLLYGRGLPFQNLPATQNPKQILTNQSKKTQDYIQSQQQRELDIFRKTRFPNRNEAINQLNQLNSKYQGLLDQEKFKSDQQFGQLKQIQSLVDAGQIDPDAGQEAMWRLVLPLETERVMFPKPVDMTPFSITQLKSQAFQVPLLEAADTAEEIRGFEWGPPKKTQQGLLDQYQLWRESIEYENRGLIKQQQLDREWDMAMRSEKKFSNWWMDEKQRKPIPEVQALRSTGKIAQAMRSRMVETPMGGGVTTPFDQSMLDIKPKTKELPGPTTVSKGQKLDEETARWILNQVGGDKVKARQMAIQMGYSL